MHTSLLAGAGRLKGLIGAGDIKAGGFICHIRTTANHSLAAFSCTETNTLGSFLLDVSVRPTGRSHEGLKVQWMFFTGSVCCGFIFLILSKLLIRAA